MDFVGRLAAALAALALIAPASGCTLVKPVACGLTAGTIETARRIESRSEEREPNDLPGPLLIAALPVLFPLNFVYWTAHGTVAGVFSGFGSDLNLALPFIRGLANPPLQVVAALVADPFDHLSICRQLSPNGHRPRS